MGDKKSLMQEITARAKKKEALKQEIANRPGNMEEFVLKLMNEVDDSLSGSINPSLATTLAPYYEAALSKRVRIVDNDAKVSISWQEASDEKSVPRVSGVHITWSKEYQKKHNCEEQLFVDVLTLLLK